jgi:hypothetical protein
MIMPTGSIPECRWLESETQEIEITKTTVRVRRTFRAVRMELEKGREQTKER